jgi:hypothetical protein
MPELQEFFVLTIYYLFEVYLLIIIIINYAVFHNILNILCSIYKGDPFYFSFYPLIISNYIAFAMGVFI